MLRKILQSTKFPTNPYSFLSSRLHTETQVVPESEATDSSKVANTDNADFGLIQTKPSQPKSVLEECTEDISHVTPYLRPSFNFAAYVNRSETLKQLVRLGVDLHKLEKKKDVPNFILGLDFERDVAKHILFLSDLGVHSEQLGEFLSKNPLILKEDLETLEVRVNYLKSKRFTDAMITRIVARNPFWLSFSTQDIDERLGYFQREFELRGDEVRAVAAKCPKLITYSLHKIKVNTFALREEMGFTPAEVTKMLQDRPKLFMKSQEFVLNTFTYVHQTMNIPLGRIAQECGILDTRLIKIRPRHEFLVTIEKAQYNSKKPNYVSLISLVSGTDAEFCENIAKTSIQAYNTFLKSL